MRAKEQSHDFVFRRASDISKQLGSTLVRIFPLLKKPSLTMAATDGIVIKVTNIVV